MKTILAGLALCLSLLASATIAEESLRTITVTGEGRVEVAPDLATVSISVRTEAETSAEALDEASAATEAVIALMKAEGVADEDIQTTSVQLSPRYTDSSVVSGRRIDGFTAYNSVAVRVRDFAKLGALMSAAVGEGANSLGGVSFGLIDPTEAQDDARRAAVADALRKANLYADAAGVALGDLMSLSEQNAGGYRPVMMAEARDAVASLQYDVPVEPGQITMSANITVVFAIE